MKVLPITCKKKKGPRWLTSNSWENRVRRKKKKKILFNYTQVLKHAPTKY